MATFGPLVTPQWLQEHIKDDSIRIVDGSWSIPKRDFRTDFDNARIPNSVFFDMDAIADTSTDLPHMLPSAQAFATAVGEQLGIRNTDRIVIYDKGGVFSSPRVWWTFKVFGAENVAVLNGGFPAWKELGFPVETGVPTPPTPQKFDAVFKPEIVKSLQDVLSNVSTQTSQVLDARGAGRFKGTEPEPRPGVASGHIPKSLNVPYPSVLDSSKLRFKDIEDLKSAFRAAGVDLNRPIITSCGTGVTASILFLALDLIGKKDVAVYDGSWTEWGSSPDTPKEL
eukprot:CAMPEP_0184650870 /NCGR_PEP_ID=MMETSP0308-20130426/8440_1 /TAXON_ID=38269 /ORGANISM="Gloeochaete witrockiana, Strain SAG 46.84" /LENGTH=281 /DNA_ID=CAMNT_0027084701 /DNA_START=153 /DNA_END=998 /DNA_ORIENTATION=-